MSGAHDDYEAGRLEKGWWWDGRKSYYDPDYIDPLTKHEKEKKENESNSKDKEAVR